MDIFWAGEFARSEEKESVDLLGLEKFARSEERESVDLLGREKFARICRVGAQKENEQEIE